MHIVFLSPVGVLGGAERVIIDAIRELSGAGIRVSLVTGAEGPLTGTATEAGATVAVEPLPRELGAVGESGLAGSTLAGIVRAGGRGVRAAARLAPYVARLKRRLRAFAPTIVHAHGPKAQLAAALATPRGVPLVWHVHDFMSARLITSKVARLARHRVDHAIAISDAVARDAKHVLSGVPVTRVYNGVDLAAFHPGAPDTSDPAARQIVSAAPQGVLRVGLVATYATWKGHRVFLEAARRVVQTEALPACRFFIVGGPIYAAQGSQVSQLDLEREAQRLRITDRLTFVPFSSAPEEVMRALDIVVHASTSPEPFGRTIVEGMASGKAVIVSDAGGAHELFHDGLTALGFPPGDAGALADRISRLLASPTRRSELGARALDHAREAFSGERFGKSLLEVYGNLLK